MINTLLGTKIRMTSTYDSRGRRVGATILEIKPNVVTQIKTLDGKDRYNAIQIGSGTKKSTKKPQLGLLKKLGVEEKMRWFREVKGEVGEINPGQKISVSDIFLAGDSVKVTGVSKGKGFQGGVRRHGFAGGPKTHGQSDRHRAPGSIGQTTTPGRVYKGKRMAGHMGAEQVSVKGLEVISVNKSGNLMTVKGGVPGAIGSLLVITKLGRIKGYTPPPEEKVEEEEESEEQMKSDKSEEQMESASQNVSESESGSTESTDTPISSDLSEKQEAKK